MKVLFLSDNFPPEVNAPATRTFEHCRRWAKAGAEVTVITCAPNFPSGKLSRGYRNHLRSVEHIEGIRVIRVWSYMAANVGFFHRTLDFISFAAAASVLGLFEPADVIVATSPQIFTAVAGFVLSTVRRKPWIFELRDLWPESIATVGQMEKSDLLYRSLERLELFLYRRATKIVSVSPDYLTNLVRRGVDRGKIEVVTNGTDFSTFGPRPPNVALRERLGVSDKFVIGYIGTHGMAHGLRFILDAAKSGPEKNAHFLFVGDGAEKRALVEHTRSNAIANVTFCDSIPKEQVPAYLAACDAVLVPLVKSDTFLSVIPSKIFEAAAMGLPILLGVDGQARAIVERYGAGVFFEPENAISFHEQLCRLAHDVSLRERLKAGGFELAAAYDRDRLAADMLQAICEVTPTGRMRATEPI